MQKLMKMKKGVNIEHLKNQLDNTILPGSDEKKQTILTVEEFRARKIEILNKDRYCQDRRIKLISHVVEGYRNKTWKFTE